ncbi:MAG: hypothetical protein QOJ51_6557 [Acidobacteriaceae bacterium]|nr:hypothetical protein [Acidobacteriaceae bacterium]
MATQSGVLPSRKAHLLCLQRVLATPYLVINAASSISVVFAFRKSRGIHSGSDFLGARLVWIEGHLRRANLDRAQLDSLDALKCGGDAAGAAPNAFLQSTISACPA